MRNATAILGFILIILLAFSLGTRHGRKTAKNPTELIVVWDTTELVIYDTIVRERPIYHTSYVYDTITTHFTTVERDTIEVEVPMERKVYEEDSLYRAVISGWRPSLDSLVIWPKTTTITITKEVERKESARWGIGLQAGMGASRTGLTPYVGVGVQYNLLAW